MTDTPNGAETSAPTIPVVAIGASAGGLEQIKLLLKRMPTDTGAAFVVIQHLDPNHQSQLTELLEQVCTLPTVTIEDQMALVADRVHILPAGYRLGMDDTGVLRLNARQEREAQPTLIDGFFRDLATARGRRAVGVVLSGTGSDGALGLKAIRSGGGLAIAQHPDSAEFDGMPRAAAKHASPDCMLDTSDMVEPLCNYLRLPLANGIPPEPTSVGEDTDITDEALAAILDILRGHTKCDFRHHKPNMLKRRLQRRMALRGVSSTRTYIASLEKDAEERHCLCGDFLISVTDFFREPDSYDKLNRCVIDRLLHGRSVDSVIRVWVPGCATGEEAYSIAMLLDEAIEASGRDYRYVVFATDIDENALAHARAGLFPESIETDVSGERLQAFFDKIDGHYRVKRSLREHVVFAPQSVTDDPPYSRLDLISCRNLLIYLIASAQARLIMLFHFALKDTGFLFLGSSETVGEQSDLFEPVSKSHRLYRRLATSRQYRVEFPTPHGARDEPLPAHGGGRRDYTGRRPREVEQIARDILLQEHVPASVLVNRKLEVLCSYGPIRDYLSLPLGESSLALMDMVRDDYRSHLRAVTHRAFRYDEKSDITTKLQDGNEQTLLLTARPLQQPEQARGLVLVTFERVPEVGIARPGSSSDGDLERQLADELDATRNELHGTIAALEESNEGLKSSNEEVMSMNEELQSTNEELETSKEELQSLNEELTTVNTELETKIEELESAHNDLGNLFSGTQVATLFLDRDMRIKRFTPAIRDLLSLISSDIGRPLHDMTLKFEDPDLLADAEKVLEDLAPREMEVRAAGDRWYQRRILPYRTRENLISGVVITFADITELRSSMLAAQEHEARLDLAVSALAGGMWEMRIDPEGSGDLPDSVYLSTRLKGLLGFTDEQMPDSLQAWMERILPEDRASFSDVLRRRDSEAGRPLHYRIRHRDGSLRWFASYGRVIDDAFGRATRWIGMDCDITDHKLAEIRMLHLQTQLQLLADALPEMVAFVDTRNTIRFANPAFNNWFGADAEDMVGRGVAEVLGEPAFVRLEQCIDTALAGRAASCDVDLVGPDHGECYFQVSHIPHVIDAKVLGYYLLMTDRVAREKWREDGDGGQARLVYVHRMAIIGEMASTLAHDLSQPLGAIHNYASGLTRMIHAGKPADDTTPVLRKIADQVGRASEIVRGVRDFVGRREYGHELIDLNRLLLGAVSLTSGRAQKMGVDMRVSEHTPLPMVKGDAVQLQQVLINLINNACEAMRDSDRDRRTLWLTTDVPDAAHVQVTVKDSGPGISPETIGSVFESFQTTKLEGMGMGLAISRSIVQWHDGHLWVESQPGQGATFYLVLPLDPARAGGAS